MNPIVTIIRTVAWVLTLLVIAQIILSYFMDPYHPVRQWIDRIVNPLLAPIRRVLPPMGGLDFSGFVLIILIQVIESVLISIF